MRDMADIAVPKGKKRILIEIKLSKLYKSKYKKYVDKLDDWALRDASIEAESIIYMPEEKKRRLLTA